MSILLLSILLLSILLLSILLLSIPVHLSILSIRPFLLETKELFLISF